MGRLNQDMKLPSKPLIREEKTKTDCREKKRKRVVMSSLNQDVIFGILIKLPSKPLIRFRLACKYWDSLISDGYFINSHMQQQRKMPCILVLKCVRKTFRLRFKRIELGPPTTANFLLEKEIPNFNLLTSRAHHCDGLLVCQAKELVHVCNPSTGELLSLPVSGNLDKLIDKENLDSVGFGFDRSINKYKIVRSFYRSVNRPAKTYSLGMEVFTLGGASNTWSPTADDPPYPVCHNRTTSAHGAVYWKIRNGLHTSSPKAILRFDLSDENFRLIDPPPPFQSDIVTFQRSATLLDIQDDLFCIQLASQHPQAFDCLLWMLNEDEKWTLSYRFKLPPGIRQIKNIAIHRGILFFTIYKSMYGLNPETSSLEIIIGSTDKIKGGTEKIIGSTGKLLTYVENLTPIGGNKEKMKTAGCRGKKRKRVSNLNQDMIFSILIKLPSKSLIRFRSACKYWDTFISGRYFINSLLQQQNMPRILMLERVPETYEKAWIRFNIIELGPPASINFLCEKEIPGPSVLGRAHHCDGLLVYQNQGSRSNLLISVCNPSTRELLSLPMSQNHDGFLNMRNAHYRDSVGFGFDRSINKYKIVRNFYAYAKINVKSYSLGMEVFTLGGASNTWKLLKHPPYPVCFKNPTSANGAVYWKVWNDVHTLPPRAILRFDLSDEEFRLIDPPPPFESDPLRFERRATLMDIQDNLFCVHSGRPQSHEFYLWMLNKEEKWTLSYRFKLPSGIRHFDNIAILKGKLLLTISAELYELNPETNSLLKIMSGIGRILTCMENLAPIGG